MEQFLSDFVQFPAGVLKKTPEGYLSGRLCVTGAGVFRYLDGGNRIVGRLRACDEVERATQSLNGKPVTLRHPSEPVTPENASRYQVGFTGTDAAWDGLNNHVTLTVTDKAAIDAIESGSIKAVSCGYNCDVTDDSGVWQGSPYSQTQRNIAYNHIALVAEGRAGDQVRFRVGDSADAAGLFNELSTKEDEHMKTIQLDGVECQADERVLDALESAKAQIADQLEDIKRLAEENLAMGEEIEKLKSELEGEDFKEAVDSAIESRLGLLDEARGLGADVSAADSDEEIRRKVIGLAFDEAELDGKSDDYLAATYDAAKAVINGGLNTDANTVLDVPGLGGGTHVSDAHDEMEQAIFKIHQKED